MRLGIAIFFQCVLVTLYAHFYHTEEEPIFASMEGEPSVTIDRSVNPISGDYIISETDMVIPGYEPIYLGRTYVSGAQKGREANWSFLPHLYMHIDIPGNPKTEPTILTIAEPSGSTIRYKNLVANDGKDRRQFFPMLGKATRGLTNTGRGELSARTNLENNHILYDKGHFVYIMTTCDGTERYYRQPTSAPFAYLEKERKPSGNWVHYEYNEDYYTLKEIRTSNPHNTKVYAKASFEYQNPNPYNSKTFSVVTEQGHRLHYFFHLDDIKKDKQRQHFFRLNCIARPHLPHEQLHYHELPNSDHTFVITNKKLDERPLADISYYEPGSVPIKGERNPTIRRIKSLEQPVAPDGSMAQTHHFIYRLGKYARNRKKEIQSHLNTQGFTECFDAYNKKTLYAFNDFFVPLYTQKYGNDLQNPKQETETALFTEHFLWSSNGFINLLQGKYYEDQHGILSARFFTYDRKGNVIEDTLVGNISGHNNHPITIPYTTRQESERYTIKNTYDHGKYGLLIRKELPNHCSYQYEYLPNTNLPTATFTLCHGEITLREFKIYNEDNTLITTILDDGSTCDRNNLTGITQRLVTSIQPKKQPPAINFPEIIEERYLDLKTNSYQLLKKVVFHYSSDCNVIQEDIYDANNDFLYSIYKTYDEKRRLTETTDALGRTSYFSYNNFNQLVEERPGNSPLKIIHSQDILGREFATSTISANGSQKENRIHYDLKSRITRTTDTHGNTARYCYDDLDHEIEKTLPQIEDIHGTVHTPIITTINDASGNPLKVTDPLGNTTTYSYNILGKPLVITHPDFSKEYFYYNLDGSLQELSSITGLKSSFIYDPLGRVIAKKVYSKTGKFLYEELSSYNAFHLISHIDEKGVKTLYRYDGAGRKSEIIKSKGDEFVGREEYFYDSLGRHNKTITYSSFSNEGAQVYLQLFDHADRLIEERFEDLSGTLYKKACYQYDQYDNQLAILTHTDQGITVETCCYDDHKREISHTDAEGNTSYTQYIERLYNSNTQTYEHEVLISDPKGRQIKERYSSTHLLLSKTFLNSLGIIEGQDYFYYDLNGNKVQQLSKVFARQELIREESTLWEYDSKNRVVTLIEAYGLPIQKVSRYTYTADGKERSVTQPNGTTLEYTYNDLSHLTSLRSSDGSVHYGFIYNETGDLIEEINFLTRASTLRTYNARGDLLQETLANGLSINKTYDGLSRTTSLILPDLSEIRYCFDPFHLKTVSRYTSDGAFQYEHNYLKYNLAHQPTEESSIFNLCTLRLEYDSLDRQSSLLTPYYAEQLEERDPCGNILRLHTGSDLNTTDSSYAYDSLDHLIEEEGLSSHRYGFDSHHNRTHKDLSSYRINELNQLIQEGASSYTYTENGNRHIKTLGNKTLIYTYDALNHLTSLKSESIEMLFTYDSWHRRLSKTVKTKTFFGYFESVYQELYLYDNEKEIASFDSSGNMTHLKVLGIGKGGDIGAAVALELNKTVYIPIHDLFGNIVQLIHAEQNYVAESYRYSAFGECSIYSYYHGLLQESALGNPWRYQSKRTDDESGLIFFGRRYFDPKVGSWISEDPLGLTEGPSLYHFLLANPLSNIDIYGLSTSAREDDDDLPIRPKTGGYTAPSPFIIPEDNPYQYTPWLLVPPGSEAPPKNTSFPKQPGIAPMSHPNYSMFYINGIDTTLSEANEMRNACSRNLGYKVRTVYNPTHGFVPLDLYYVSLHFLYRPSQVATELKTRVMQEIDSGKGVFIFAHSAGGAVTYNVLDALPQSYRDKIYVVTFGSARFIPKHFAKIAINYVSKRDWISKASDTWAYTKSTREQQLESLSYQFDIRWLEINSKNPFTEHSFMNKTYQRALEDSCKYIRKDFF